MTKEEDTENDRLKLKEGDIIANEYRVVSEYHPGISSNVYRCVNIKNNTEVAIKCFRNSEMSSTHFMKSIALYKNLQKMKDFNEHFCDFFAWFYFDEHPCIVIERYGPSLYDVMKFNHFRGWRLETIRQVLTQTIQALILLRNAGKLHGDIKLENILIDPNIRVSESDIFLNTGKPQPKYVQVKLIDMETTHNYYQWGSGTITTIYYRAPETILGIPWGREVDIWSLGCLALEMCVGKIYFAYSDLSSFLFAIQHLIGPFPDKMINDCTIPMFKRLFENGILNPKYIGQKDYDEINTKIPLYRIDMDHDLKGLIMNMLSIDPLARPTLDDLLLHPFLRPPE